MNLYVVINEIAKQLGLAAEQVEGAITELWPLYVEAFKIQTMFIGFVSVFAFAISLILLVVFYKKGKKNDWNEFSDVIITLTIIVFNFVFFFMTMVFTPQAISCLVNPDGTAMIHLINILKG